MTSQRESLSSLLTNIVLATCALTLTVVIVKRERRAPVVAAPTGAPTAPRELTARVTEGDGRLAVGAPRGAITFVVFTDYQCPFCRVLEAQLDSLRERSTRPIRVAYRFFPLRAIHPLAVSAASAAVCAADQSTFAPYHRALFAQQDSLSDARLLAIAKTVGVRSAASFKRCLSSKESASVVANDEREAERLGLVATPTVIVGKTVVTGLPKKGWLDSVVTATK